MAKNAHFNTKVTITETKENMRQFMTVNSVFYLQKEMYDDVHDYEDDFKKVIQQRECMRVPFSHHSPQIAYRKHLVEYIKKICIDKAYSQSCLHLAVYILDVFMDNHCIIPEKIFLVANVCLLLAAKFEENIINIPKLSDLNARVNNQYTTEDYKNLEILLLKFFDFYIMFPTPAHYTYYYMRKMVCLEDLQGKKDFRSLFYDLHWAITTYLDQVIDNVHYMQHYKPSKLAAAVISASRSSIGLSPWCKQLKDLTEYSLHELKEPLEFLLRESILNCANCSTLKLNEY